jgi:hypothetical protein
MTTISVGQTLYTDMTDHFAHRAVRRRIPVKRDGFRTELLTLDRLREEGLGCSDIAPGAAPKVDRPSRSIDCTVKIDPFATDFQMRLVDAP